MGLPTRPVSNYYGYDRGTPVDRIYIEAFLEGHAQVITGRCAEVKDSTYADRYGRNITSTTVIDIDSGNPHATLIADLAKPGSLPEASFDCVILPHTLQLLPQPGAALTNCWRALALGGTILITVPAVGRLSMSTPETDCWRLPPAGLMQLLRCLPLANASGSPGNAPAGAVAVSAHGNLRSCLAMLMGYAAEELPEETFQDDDPGHPLISCAVIHRRR